MPNDSGVNFTTTLPDEPQPSVSTPAPGEISVSRGGTPSNYGTVRYQLRQAGESAWDSSAAGFAEHELTPQTTSTTFTGLVDGAEYEIRGRTETEHITGTWTTPVSTTTSWPAPTDLQFSQPSDTAGHGQLDWTSEAADPDGVRIYHRYNNWDEWVQIADLPGGTESFSYENAPVTGSADYRVVEYNEYGSGSATAETFNPAEVELAGGTARRDPSGWTVRLQHPNGPTVEPTLLDDVRYVPTVDGLPRVRVPVPYDEAWLAAEWEDAKMRVWQNGQVYPIEQLLNVEPYPNRMVLAGIGGVALLNHTDYHTAIGGEPVHTAIDDLLFDVTSAGDMYEVTTPSDPPTVYGRQYSDTGLAILSDLCDYGDFNWEITVRDNMQAAEDDELAFRIDVAQPGSRPPSVTHQQPLDFEMTKSREDTYSRVKVYGERQSYTGYQFTYNEEGDGITYIDLPETNVWKYSTELTTPDGSTTFDPGTGDIDTDYRIRPFEGRLAIDEQYTSLTDGNDYVLDFEWKPVGTATADTSGADLTRHVTGISTSDAATDAAEFLLDKLSTPRYEGQATLPTPGPTESLVVNRDLKGVPTNDQTVEVEGVDHQSDAITFNVGTRDSMPEVVDLLQSQLQTITSQRG